MGSVSSTFQSRNGINEALNSAGRQIPYRDVSFVIAVEGTECNRETVRASANDFQGDIGLMAMHPDKQTHIDLVLPNGEIRMIRINFSLWDDFRIFRSVIRHRDHSRGDHLRQRFYDGGFF